METDEMVKSKGFIIAVLGVILVAFFMSSFGVTGQASSFTHRFLYDDFSGTSLDTSKWAELPGSNVNSNFLDEHFVHPGEGKYHTAQLSPLDAGARINLIGYTFVPGDILDYEVYHWGGNGNNIHAPDVNGQNGIQVALFGTWNSEVFCAGNSFGKYRVRMKFTPQGTTTTIRKPDGNVVACPNFDNLITGAQQYTFALTTRTGHNGIVHMDYDDVYITTKVPDADIYIPTPPPPPPPTLPLLAYWKFDEGVGFVVNDSVHGIIGTLQNGVVWTPDSFSGYALDFDGIDDRVYVGQPAVFNLYSNVSIEAWIKRYSAQDGIVVSKNGPYYLRVAGNKVESGVYVNSGSGNMWHNVFGVTNIPLNQWYKVAMSYDGTYLQVYVNDVLDGSLALTGTMPYTGQNFYIGWGLPGQDQYFHGIIDEVKIFGS